MLHPEVTFNFHCRWWYKSLNPHNADLFRIRDVVEDRRSWIVRMNSAPSQNTIRQTLAKDCKYEVSVGGCRLDDYVNRLLMLQRLSRMCFVFHLLCLTRKHRALAK